MCLNEKCCNYYTFLKFKMNTPKSYLSMYLRFINLIQAIRDLPTFPKIDPVEERLLNIFAICWLKEQKLTVLEAMNMSPDVSPTTVHRRLKSLRSKGFIDLSVDAIDTRIKYIVPTMLTEQYFTLMGKCLGDAMPETP